MFDDHDEVSIDEEAVVEVYVGDVIFDDVNGHVVPIVVAGASAADACAAVGAVGW